MKKVKTGRLPDVPYFKDILPSRNNKIGIKGVYWHKPSSKWCAAIQAFGEKIILGYFDNIDEAEKALNKARNEFNTKEDVEKFKANQKPKMKGRNSNVAYFKDETPSKNNKSGVKGVYWHKRSKMWVAVLTVYGKKIEVGYFNSVPEAEKALNEARKNIK